jgi:putative colanic acid biosynthesis UDP-glucose lipid carrier transferase
MFYYRGVLHQRSAQFDMLHRIIDSAIILAALWVCTKGYGVALKLQYQLAGLAAVIGFQFFAEWHALYGSWRADSIRHESWAIMSTWLFNCSMLLALFFFSKTAVDFSRVAILEWELVVPVLLMVERVFLRYSLRRFREVGFNSRSVAIVGWGRSAGQLVDLISASPWMGLHIENMYDTLENAGDDESSQDIVNLLQRVSDGKIDCVYITYPMQQEDRIRQLVAYLSDSTVSVYIVPDVFVTDLLHARWNNVGNIPLVSIFESPFYGLNRLIKRMEDIVLGSVILLLISPLMLLIAIIVKIDSAGPVLFKQRRYGLNGQVIEVWKFRSMIVLEDGMNITQARKNDPRITKVGAFLRKTSLDELPQFINVLQGKMSIVGPRPHAVAHNEQYRKLINGYMLRHKIKPGITGLAQVKGWRGETDTMEKMQMRVNYDLEYLNKWSIWLDLEIIVRTIVGGMLGKNAF